jgi:hypothetical protein
MSLKLISVFYAFVTLMISSTGFSQSQTVKSDFPVDSIQGLEWLDRSKNTVSLELLTFYPNGCYSLEQSIGLTSASEMKIFLSQSVLISDGPCTQAIVAQVDMAPIFLPAYGQYKIIDSSALKVLGWVLFNEGGISIQTATH